jgi:hypothetical protein
MSTTKPSLDHLILLLPYNALKSPAPSFTNHFTLYPGGNHADNVTTNTLIPLRSGTYIELIAFIPAGPDASESELQEVDRKRGLHWWGRKKTGWVDWCLTAETETSVPRSEKVYGGPREGARLRLDGQRVAWSVVFPQPKYERGSIPFWCFDRTPRVLRAPEDEAAVKHPSGALGVASLRLVTASDEDSMETIHAYADIVDSDVERVIGGYDDGNVAPGTQEWRVKIGHPKPVKLGNSTNAGERRIPDAQIRVATASTVWEKQKVKEANGQAILVEVILYVENNNDAESIEETIDGGVVKIGFVKVEKGVRVGD